MSGNENGFPRLRVECYAGYRGEETPRCFYFGRRRVGIAEVIDRWLAPDHRYFKVEDTEGNRYILRHDSESGCWELTSYNAGSSKITETSLRSCEPH